MFLLRSLSYTPRAGFSEELLFTRIVLFSGEFFLHSSGHAVLMKSFSYTPQDGFIEEFNLHSSSWF